MIRRLWAYCHKIFSLQNLIQNLQGVGFSKKLNEPLITAILFLGMSFRLPSINALAGTLTVNRKSWEKLLDAEKLPSATTLGRSLQRSDIQGLRHIAAEINHKLRRNKAYKTGDLSHGLMVVAIDGHETFSSKKRCCSKCQKRKVKVAGRTITEYYHRYVFCQLILGAVPSVIDIEPILPKEGEVKACKRMIGRILHNHRHLIDVFSFDALYLDASLLNMLDQNNKYWVVVLKQENRQAYAEIDSLLAKASSSKIEIGRREVHLWDFPELVCWDSLDRSFRGVVSQEKWFELERDKKGNKLKVEKTCQWRWLTNMPSIYPAAIIYKVGHGRWDIENRGFNELVNQCHLDHPFHHHPHALLAILWIISIAFVLSYTFFQQNLKPQLRQRIQTRQLLVELLKQSLIENGPPLFACSP